ncbi:MAG: hypothetical protein ABL962_13180 [Fimbriimonadaceae bacterium]
MKHLLRLSPLLLLVLTGCVRTNSLTEVNPDGSWKRTVKFILAKNSMSEKDPTIAEVAMPPTGPGWKATSSKKDDEFTFTYTRDVKLDEVITKDIALIDKDGLTLVNEVTVKQIAPNRFKYRETFKWVGKSKAKGSTELTSEDLKAMLPAFSTAEDLAKVRGQLTSKLTRILMGPGDPMLLQLVANPDYGLRRMVNRMAKSFDQILTDVYGDRLDMAARTNLVKKIIETATDQTVNKTKSDAEKSGTSGDSAPPTSMFMSVKLPGRIVETDGEVDPFSGEVFWSMFPEAAALGEVSIMAVCEIGG